MPSDALSPQLEDLMQHDAWLRGLVRGLIQEEDVDDVVQQTWAAAVENPPTHGTAPRGWLATVARNFALRTRRSTARRASREARAARRDELPSTEDTLQQLEVQRQVTRAVSELPEPYRTAVLLRYFHELPMAEIASRTDVSVDTAKQRVKRGRDLLRQRLGKEYGASWRGFAPLLALASPDRAAVGAGAATGITAGAATALPLVIKLAVTAACVVGVVSLAVMAWNSGPGGSPPVGAGSAGLASTPGSDNDEPNNNDAAKTEGTDPASTTRTPVAGSTPTEVKITGRVLDPLGQPIPRALIGFQAAKKTWQPSTPQARPWPETLPLGASPTLQELGRATAQGTFSVAVTQPGCLLVAGEHAPVRAWGTRADNPEDDALLIAAPAVTISGRVVDSDGKALQGVTIKPDVPSLLNFPEVAERTMPVHYGTGSCGERFELARLPGGALTLYFEKPRYLIHIHNVAAQSKAGLEIELPRISNAPKRLTGRVVDRARRPVNRATVGLGEHRTTTDAEGHYAIDIQPGDYLPTSAALYATKTGQRSAVVERYGAVVLAGGSRTEGPDLVLEGTSLEITGRVLDAQGNPAAGQLVFLWDGTPVDQFDHAENLALDGSHEPIVIAGYPVRTACRTGADGAFALAGLNDRTYRIRVLDEALDVAMTSNPIPAGWNNVALRWPADRFRSLQGRVVTAGGRAVAGAAIEFGLVIYRLDEDSTAQGKRVATTDAQGRFRIERMPRYETWLDVSGESIVKQRVEVPPQATGPLSVQVWGIARVRVEVVDPALREAADGFALLDAAGERLQLTHRTGSGSSSSSRWRLDNGRSPILATGRNAVTLVLLEGSRELERVAVQLTEDVTTLRR